MALAPGNNMNVVSAMGLYKMARRTSVNGTLQFTTQSQDEALIPWTINPVIANPSVSRVPSSCGLAAEHRRSRGEGDERAAEPELAAVPYPFSPFDTVTTIATTRLLSSMPPSTFASTPSPKKSSTAFRSSSTPPARRSTRRRDQPVRWGALRAGYGHDAWDRRGRGFSGVGDDLFRVSFDTFTNQYVTLRAGFEGSWRRGEGFIESGVDYEGPGGTQPRLRVSTRRIATGNGPR